MFRPGALRFQATIGAGYKMVQLPTGFAYDEGDVVTLTEREAEMLDPDAVGPGLPIETLTPVRGFEVGEDTYSAFGVTSLAVTPATPSVVGTATQQFVATATLDDGTTVDVSSDATWTSSDVGAATVDGDGLATGVAAGSTTITATLGGVSGTATLTVT